MKIRTTLFKLIILITISATPLPSLASQEKCEALGRLAATMHKHRATENETVTLERMQQKANSVDYAFIKLFAGMAYNPKVVSTEQVSVLSKNFCSQVVASIQLPVSTSRTSNFCKAMGNYRDSINTYRKSGDTETSIKRSFASNWKGGSSYSDRLALDYLGLLVDLRFSPVFQEKSDETFSAFSNSACVALEELARGLGKAL